MVQLQLIHVHTMWRAQCQLLSYRPTLHFLTVTHHNTCLLCAVQATVLSDEDAPGVQWHGKAVSFMRSNDHSKERRGKWDTTGLTGPALQLVRGDEKAPNWLSKLGVAKELLVDSAPRLRPDLDALIHGFVYLQWVSTGAIACVEGGGHYRPNHHAKLGQQIFRCAK